MLLQFQLNPPGLTRKDKNNFDFKHKFICHSVLWIVLVHVSLQNATSNLPLKGNKNYVQISNITDTCIRRLISDQPTTIVK